MPKEFQSPIGTQKTYDRARINRNSLEFQSPIGTQKTANKTSVDYSFREFQSPIGTQKTFLELTFIFCLLENFNPL